MSLKAALQQSQKTGLLHVARPRGCNTQQTPPNRQHPNATTGQRGALEASNDGASRCNTPAQQPCNRPAKAVQQTGPGESPFVASIVALKPGARRWWVIRLPDGRTCRLLSFAGMTRDEALEAAIYRWPGAVVLDPEGATNGY